MFEAACRRVDVDSKSKTDVFPDINELLDLAYTHEPVFIRARTPKDTSREYWLPPVEGNKYDLNSKGDCTLVRRARAAYVENYDGPSIATQRRGHLGLKGVAINEAQGFPRDQLVAGHGTELSILWGLEP